MRRRVLVAILSVTAIAIVLFGVPLAIVVERFVDDDATLRVERQAVLASREVPTDFATGNDPVELPTNDDGIVFALYGADGALITGRGPSQADGATTLALGNQVVDVEIPRARVVAVPVAADERVIGVIRAEQSTAASDARTRQILALLGGLALGVIAIGAAIGWILAGRLTRPVRLLRDAAVQLGDGDFTIAVPRSRVPELDEAALAMTATALRLDDLVTRERAFSADASHQLRTPLAGLRAAIETELEFPRPDSTIVLHEAISDIDRLERTITELLTIARTSKIATSPVTLADVLADVESMWQRRFTEANRALTIAPARYTPNVKGNTPMLQHAIDVLLDNALRHGAGEVCINHHISDDTVTVTISDNGHGFASGTEPPADLDSSNTLGSLHGLGLPLAQRLIDAMPGRLTITHSGPNPRIDIVLQRAVPTQSGTMETR
jgi:signal transduction histidine kinase